LAAKDCATTCRWEAALRRYEVLEAGFQRMQSARYADKRAARALAQAERVCTELDERAGIGDNELLRPPEDSEGREGDELPAERAWPTFQDECNSAAAGKDPFRLLQLLLYLRETHRYCLFCATRFDDLDDLERNCPGTLEEDHDD